ncbi:prolyl oligopeptidase family serine peptidase [Prosthecobacter sp.]|uniref:prolyl oligopeptidase family serine peptidase n=1 Tax=Prosthecobacter sp. TaxID=1965333 RepID=UPI0037831C83
MKRLLLPFLALSAALADGPKDNSIDNVRPVPPPGVAVPDADRARLTECLKKLRTAIDEAAKAQAKNPQLADLLPDIEIYHKAVDWALRYNEVHKLGELKSADEIIAEGLQRAEQFKTGQAPWTKQKGLVVRAYRSKIDGSVQPYGMVIPESYVGAPVRTDIWCHGRGETLSELSFLDQRRKQVGQITPKGALVLHAYGRYCCANKFAGEIDLIEAIDHASKFYAIDEDRIIVRGFSMGGAAAWQFAVNYADKWCAANPGAGFSETPEFLGGFQNEDVSGAPWYQQKLWHWYNATDNALNLENCPTVAYSGEIDKQKQAADMMEKALRGENVDLLHIIGPQTAHKIHPDSLVEIEKRLASIAAIGRNRMPKEVHLSTWFLRYNHMFWVKVDALEEHWVRGRIHARITGPSEITIKLQNISAFTLDMPSGHCPMPLLFKPVVSIDGQLLEVTRPKLDRSWLVHFQLKNGKWTQTLDNEGDGKLVKKHGLEGPIDDAFMDKFLFVKPTKAGASEKVDAWAKAELERAQFEWRRQFRGDAPTKDDTAVSDADIAANNLVLWGDPQSNAVLAKIADKLPIQWSKDKLVANGKTYDAATNAPVLIYPNPLNPTKYVVINSGFTYREYDYLNNARQVAKLPDWAVIDLTKPKTSQAPGGISDAGFFGESWEWKAAPVKK